jgi:RNA polymerase sigma-70 factor (ECF subfamily)
VYDPDVTADAAARLQQLLDRGEHRAAQALLYEEHGQAVRRFVAGRVPAGAVDDVCQEVWAAVVRGLDGARLRASPRLWVFGIARNKSHDAWRARAPAETLDSQLAGGGALAEVVGVRPPTTPTRELSRRRRAVRTRRALAALREDEREVLELRFAQGLKPAEIAVVVGASANAVSQRIVRASRRLRELLVEGAGDGR